MLIGTGYDVHRLEKGRKLVLGGVTIPFEKGLEGHSDADVLVHAIIDSLLGASGNRDIGYQCPDTDEQYRNISSMKMLEKTNRILQNAGLTISNIDSTIMAEKPALSPYIQEMRENVAKTLNIPVSRVAVKATTTEGLGFIGRGEGIAAQAMSSLITVKTGQ